jgi:cholest-4-en-3-one 26-monooxygenase
MFDAPDDFDLRRDPNNHLAFGYGAHKCLGSNLARLELRIIFEELLRKFPDLSLEVDDEPAYRPANFVSGYESLPVLLGDSVG